MAFLELASVRKVFGDQVAVQGFDLGIDRGELVSFLGPSGCGKTTTLRMVAGFEIPTSGRIVLDGKDITNRSPNRRNVGMVFQSYALFPNMTAADNIGFGLKVRGVARDRIKAKVEQMLDLIHLAGRGGRYPHELSGGMQQRVALARALAIEPQVLLLDEPLSALDAKIRVALRQEIRSIQRQLGITTIYVTHDQEEALSLSDRVVVMSEGRIEQVGTPADIYNSPSTEFVARFVGTLSVLSATVLDAPSGRLRIADRELLASMPLPAVDQGTTVSVALRPEAVTLDNHRDGGNRLDGVVDDVTFLGSVVRVRVRLDGDAGLVVSDQFNDPHRAPPEHGSAVTVAFPVESTLVLQPSATTS
jgi:putative spermidine/putrescine transport system ATP-binding protein